MLEDDGDKRDPRFDAKVEELEEAGIEDYQLHYAVRTLNRVASLTGSTKLAGGQN